MLTPDDKYLLNNAMGAVANKVQLGTKLEQALGAESNSSDYVVFSGKHTTVGGGAAEVIAVAGVLATDKVIVGLEEVGTVPRTVLTAAPSAGEITVTFSGDPDNDHVVTYMVLRSVS